MIYEYRCPVCTITTEAIRRLADRDLAPHCFVCDVEMDRTILTPPAVHMPEWNLDYKCVATGEHVTSQAQRKRIMKENNLADARDFGEPDWEKMDSDHKEFHEIANKPTAPPELVDAMKREGHADLL